MHSSDHETITHNHAIVNMFGLKVTIAKFSMFFFVLSLNIEIKQQLCV